MWDAPFDDSLLNYAPGVIVRLDTEELAEELMRILGDYGYVWAGGSSMTDERAWWVSDATCLRVIRADHTVKRGDRPHYEKECYPGYIRCTFRGVESDFAAASDKEMEAFLAG